MDKLQLSDFPVAVPAELYRDSRREFRDWFEIARINSTIGLLCGGREREPETQQENPEVTKAVNRLYRRNDDGMQTYGWQK
jgi:hypothetical protein